MTDCLAAVGQPVCPAAQALLPIAAQQRLACAGERWVRSLPSRMEALYDQAASQAAQRLTGRSNASGSITAGLVDEPRGHARFNAMMERPHEPACALSRFGRGDGAKLLCGLESLVPQCTVFSIGSRGDIQFELSVLRICMQILELLYPRAQGARTPPGHTSQATRIPGYAHLFILLGPPLICSHRARVCAKAGRIAASKSLTAPSLAAPRGVHGRLRCARAASATIRFASAPRTAARDPRSSAPTGAAQGRSGSTRSARTPPSWLIGGWMPSPP